jgi:hypothetical protein
MNFDLIKAVHVLNEETSEMEASTESAPHRAALEDGTLKVWVINGADEALILTQPWKNENDGSRSAWTDLDEGVAWFKSDNQHQGA